jgi:hypothetical protein
MTKKRAVTYTLFAFSAFFIYSHGLCWAISITPKPLGEWSKTIGSSDLTAGAGSDLNPGPYESSSNAVVINISGTAGAWAVTVSRDDTYWNSNIHLFIQRTSDGEGTGTISGGNTYNEVAGTSSEFFNGTNDRSNINIQLKLELTGTPRIISPGVYSSTVTYTVTG